MEITGRKDTRRRDITIEVCDAEPLTDGDPQQGAHTVIPERVAFKYFWRDNGTRFVNIEVYGPRLDREGVTTCYFRQDNNFHLLPSWIIDLLEGDQLLAAA